MTDTNDFHDLVNAAELMAAGIDGTSDLPKWNRTVHQLAEAAEEMWERIGSKSNGQMESQANALLAPIGVDISQMTQKLTSLSTRMTFQPLDPVGDVDVKAFLRNEYENGILSVLSLTQKLSAQTVQRTTWSHMKSTWQAEKIRLTNAMLGSEKSYLEMPTEMEESSMIDAPCARSMLSQQEMAYARGVADYNQAVMDGSMHPNLVSSFCEIARSFQDKRVLDIWEMVKYMVDVPTRNRGDVLAARASVQNDLILQAKKYLEKRYMAYMNSIVSGNLQKAKRGGIPGTFPLVRSFVEVRVSKSMIGLEDGRFQGQPVWPLIYYCLRCGDVSAAMEVARGAESSLTEFSSVLESLVQSADSRLGARLEQRVKAEYRRHTRNTTDPFKRAVYCIVGACDINDEHQEIAVTADDYLWLKLCQIRHEDNAEKQGECMTYTHLQSLILDEFGEGHYKANEQPLVYFQMLILTSQFEAAVEFLFRTSKFKVHGVHVAIALHEMGLLADPPSVLAPLLTALDQDKPPARRLNFVRLICLYARTFQASDPREALHYFYFLRDISNEANENMFTLCVAELVQESREFSLILGRMESDGCRNSGLIDWFKGLKQSPADVIRHVAIDCENKGNLEDAIHLFDLCKDHEKVLSIMNTLLTQVVTQISKEGSLRARLQKLALEITSRYGGSEITASADTASTFYILKDLLVFFDQFHAGHYSQALETITRSKLLPFTKDEKRERVANFQRLSDQVKRQFADVLVVVMTILQNQYHSAKGSDPHSPRLEDSTRDKQQILASIREKARVITDFAGSIPYRMKGDTSSRLVQMQILMQ